MSNQRLMKAKEKAGDGYAKTNAIAPPDAGAIALSRPCCPQRPGGVRRNAPCAPFGPIGAEA